MRIADLYAVAEPDETRVLDELRRRARERAAARPTSSADPPRIMATFVPEMDRHGYVYPLPELAYEFDVTEQVLAMDREEALAIQDGQYSSDDLWNWHPVCEEKDWPGPFTVYAEDAIRAYFAGQVASGNDAPATELPS